MKYHLECLFFGEWAICRGERKSKSVTKFDFFLN